MFALQRRASIVHVPKYSGQALGFIYFKDR